MLKAPSVIRIIIKAVLIPLISVFALNKFNLFSYITFIPEEKQFDVGLTTYLGIVEALAFLLENTIEMNRPRITCVFYVKQSEKDIRRTPTIICGKDSLDVAIVRCELVVSGNARLFKENILSMSLPEWLSSQVSTGDRVVTYTENRLLWNFSKAIPCNSWIGINAKCDMEIPLIRSQDKDYLDIVLRPTIIKRWMRICASFETNTFKICNKEL